MRFALGDEITSMVVGKFKKFVSSLKALHIPFRSLLRLFFFGALFVLVNNSVKGQKKYTPPSLRSYISQKEIKDKKLLPYSIYSPYLWKINGDEPPRDLPFILRNSLIEASSILKESIQNGIINPDVLSKIFDKSPNFSKSEWDNRAVKLLEGIISGQYSIEIVIASQLEMKGAMASFSKKGLSNPTMFLQKEFLENKTSDFYPELSKEKLTSIIIEEIGHYFDYLLNIEYDTKGDEGEL
ncbi:MAG: hypothetical protein RLY46_784, partial [Bacteroidota bacterium]